MPTKDELLAQAHDLSLPSFFTKLTKPELEAQIDAYRSGKAPPKWTRYMLNKLTKSDLAAMLGTSPNEVEETSKHELINSVYAKDYTHKGSVVEVGQGVGPAAEESTGNDQTFDDARSSTPSTATTDVTTGRESRCLGVTKKNERCRLSATENGFCWQHQHQIPEAPLAQEADQEGPNDIRKDWNEIQPKTVASQLPENHNGQANPTINHDLDSDSDTNMSDAASLQDGHTHIESEKSRALLDSTSRNLHQLVETHAQLHRTIAQLQQTNAQLQQTNAQLQQTNAQLQQTLQQTNAQLKQTNARLQLNIAQLQASKSSTSDIIRQNQEEARQTIDSQQEEINRAVQEVHELRREISDKDEEISDKDEEISDKDEEIVDKDAEISDKDAQIHATKAEVERITSEMGKLKKENASLKTIVEIDTSAELRKENDSLRTRIKSLEQENEARSTRGLFAEDAFALATRVSSLESAHSKMSVELLTRIQSLERENKTLTTRVSSLDRQEARATKKPAPRSSTLPSSSIFGSRTGVFRDRIKFIEDHKQEICRSAKWPRPFR
jgi:chromosome segregation ATPase